MSLSFWLHRTASQRNGFSLGCLICFWLTALTTAESAEEIVLEQVISREHAAFRCAPASLNVGRDGMVYLCSGGNPSYVLRVSRDGKQKYGLPIVYAATNATANADGVVASANGHFAHKVTIYDQNLKQIAECADFLVSDQAGWDAPAEVEAGVSGDFYGIDQHRDRILRLDRHGKILKAYSTPREPPLPQGQVENLRVCEKKEMFYVLSRGGGIRSIGFDGKMRWQTAAPLAGQWYLRSRAFDCDDDGNLYVLENQSETVKKFTADGKPAAEIKLQIGDRRPPSDKTWFFALRVVDSDIIIRREHPIELFQVYDLTTGAFKHAVHADCEVLRAKYPSPVWDAGEAAPFRIEFENTGQTISPRWRLWARPLEAPDYEEWRLEKDSVRVPAAAAGLYRIKLTPEVQPREQGLDAQIDSEYLLQALVEVRAQPAVGSLSVFTPDNRIYFSPGETVPIQIAAKTGQAGEISVSASLRQGRAIVAEQKISCRAGETSAWILSSAFTAALRPGSYLLVAEAAKFTSVPQRLFIGPAWRDPSFFFVQYGDYENTYPATANIWNIADAVAAQCRRLNLLGINLAVDRIGWWNVVNATSWDSHSLALISEISKRLEVDPAAPHPAKAKVLFPFPHSLAGYSAAGIRQMGILMANDAGLPLGTGFDNRRPEQILECLQKVTEICLPFPAFRGWSWSSNWWIFNERGSAAAKDAQERAAYEAALKEALGSGKWAPILDKVAGNRLGLAVEAQELFNRKLKEIAPMAGYRTAVAAPYRNVEAYPPISFANVDEVDLHIQWEQMAVPYHAPHNVDFYKRPGKRGWAHPEIWNDDGTGGQVLPILFQLAMRGADGVGFSGKCPPWASGMGLPDDPRVAHYGYTSVMRAFGQIARAYGQLWAKLENNDQVAIAASGRMYKIDNWEHVTGLHFARQLEAYITCLHAHRPAIYVFAEDITTPDALKRYAAVLLVDERVELEPQLMAALKAAQAAGAAVFYDQTCRQDLFGDFTPLGLAFDKLEKDRSPAGDDAAYWRFQHYAKANLPVFNQALAKIKPAAAADDDEVLTSIRRAEKGRYLWVVNNTQPRLEPAHLWRMNLSATTRVPFVCGVSLAEPAAAVYDVFAMQKARMENGKIQADLRSLPGRFYALLPAEIAAVELKAPAAVKAGQALSWQASSVDGSGKPIAALVPLRLRLMDKDGACIYENFHVCGSKPAADAIAAPWNAAGPLLLEASELFSGKRAALAIQITAAPLPPLLAKAGSPASKEAAHPAEANKSIKAASPAADLEPAQNLFGPHCRDLVVLANGKTAVVNTMNWDHNLYAIDLDIGQTRWRQRLGHYFAFAPQPLRLGMAVQGFDFNSPHGYHLYLVNADGRPDRRFALYGLPKRLPFRFVPGLLCEERQGLNGAINNFAVPPDGSWVATAGDLGLAVWNREGKLLWKLDWYKTRRQPAFLAALSEKTLLAVENMVAVFYEALSGAKKGEIPLAATGSVKKIALSGDGKTAAVIATSESGLIFVVRGNRIERVFHTPAEDTCLSSDAAYLAAAAGNRLKLYSLAHGLQWSYAADDRVRFPRFAPDNKRLAFSTDSGAVAVVDIDGAVLWESDLGSRAALAWLPDGDLLAATWMGKVLRFGGDFKAKWQTLLAPEAHDMRVKLLADDGAPTIKIDDWSNAEAAPLAIAPNLLAENPVICRLVPSGAWGGAAQLAMDPKILWDGKPEPPPQPWIDWSYVGFFAETSPINYLLIDAFRKQLRVEAITFFEDAAHPESWLREAKLEYWDAATEKWITACELLANAAVHSHKLAATVEAARFRLLLPWGCVGNLRLAEIVFHGTALGCSHPDAAAGKAVAVLFDEQDDIKHCLMYGNNGLSFKMDEAYSGGRSLALSGSCRAVPLWQPPFGHVVPNWDFEIVEKPSPGQYRWLQFAWKALSPNTHGITVRLAGIACHAGEYARISEHGETPRKLADKPPLAWKVERIDLWEAAGKKDARVQDIGLAAIGDGALVDQILLAASPKDLEAAAAAHKLASSEIKESRSTKKP